MLTKHCVSEKMTSPIAQGYGGSHALFKGVALSCLYEDNILCLNVSKTLDVSLILLYIELFMSKIMCIHVWYL